MSYLSTMMASNCAIIPAVPGKVTKSHFVALFRTNWVIRYTKQTH